MKSKTTKHGEDCYPEDRIEGQDCGCRTCSACGETSHKDGMRECDDCGRAWCNVLAPACKADAGWLKHPSYEGDLCGRCADRTSAKSDLDHDERAPLVFHATPRDLIRAARDEE